MDRAWWLGLVLLVPACKTTQGPTPTVATPKMDPLLASGGLPHDPARAQAYRSGASTPSSSVGTATALNSPVPGGE